MTPLLSVVIPTFQRPIFLKRAIASALGAAPSDEVEVLVIPNGPDDSWKSVAKIFRGDARVNFYEMALGNACAARNYGLNKARGKYIRFLDDDDYLYPSAAEQLIFIESRHADIYSAPLEIISKDGLGKGFFEIPSSGDYPTVAFLSIGISGFGQGSIFKRAAIQHMQWREDIVLYDDYLWMLDLAEIGELDWRQTAIPVGAYVQHDNPRLSRIRRSGKNSKPLVAAILQLHHRLAATGRATPERTHAAATALLTHAHSAFPSNPIFLSKAIKHAHDIDPSALPIQAIFHSHPWLGHNLLTFEWMMMAPRYFTRGYRRASWFVKGLFSQTQSTP